MNDTAKTMTQEDEKATLTENETAVIRAYMNDCFVKDHGWESPDAAAWTQGFHAAAGLAGKVFSGTMASLVKKGLINSYDGGGDPNDAFFSLTEAGRKAARGITA